MHGAVAFMLDRMSKTVLPSRARPADEAQEGPGHPRLGRVLAYIHQNLGEPLPLQKLAGISQLSVWRFATVFRLTVGMTPHRYVTLKRIRRAQALLRQGHSPSLAANECGFYDQSHLSRCLKSACGMTPRQFQAAALPACQPTNRPTPFPIPPERVLP